MVLPDHSLLLWVSIRDCVQVLERLQFAADNFLTRLNTVNPCEINLQVQLAMLISESLFGSSVDGIKCRVVVHKQDFGSGCCRVKVLEDGVEGQHYIQHVPKTYILHGIQERVRHGLEAGSNKGG